MTHDDPTLPPRQPASDAPTLPPAAHPPSDAPTLPPNPAAAGGDSTLPHAGSQRRGGPPEVPGYEILSELGRGGMGVVYKARDTRLNRTVALKMVLSGGHADPKELVRFLSEAEAVAAVEHPHVVRVFGYGEQDGRPFMALEFCAGGSLAGFLKGAAMRPADAAALVAKVARGVQAAHALGIVHRDLKPGNVLLGEDGSPKVTDFGLAKRGDGSGLTQTNAVMGTPAYMAPEQARGQTKFVGPAADVYALGVILYECLAGRPPFQANDEIALMMKVVEAEPSPLSEFVRRVPHDLETIVLKCLNKDPARRYATAGELADDLDRFLAGEPILARRMHPVERAFRYVKQQPGQFGAVGGIGLLLLGASFTAAGGAGWFVLMTVTLVMLLLARLPVVLIVGSAATIAFGLATFLLLPQPDDSSGIALSESLARTLWLSSEGDPGAGFIGWVNLLGRLDFQSDTPRVLLALGVLALGMFAGTVVGFAANRRTWTQAVVVPGVLLLATGGVLAASRDTWSLVGGVLPALYVGFISRGVARWLKRELLGTVSGAFFGILAGLLGVLILSLILYRTLGAALLTAVLGAATFVVCTVLGAMRGAVAGKVVKPAESEAPSARRLRRWAVALPVLALVVLVSGSAFVPLDRLALVLSRRTNSAHVGVAGPEPAARAGNWIGTYLQPEQDLPAPEHGLLGGRYFPMSYLGYTGSRPRFLILPLLWHEEIADVKADTADGVEFAGRWVARGGPDIPFRCTFPPDGVAGQMELAGVRHHLTRDCVFLVRWRAGGPPEVRAIEVALGGTSWRDILRGAVTDSGEIRAALLAELVEGLQSQDAARRRDAALCAFRLGLGGKLTTPQLVGLLGEEGWVRLTAAAELWTRERHAGAVPALSSLLGRPGDDGLRALGHRLSPRSRKLLQGRDTALHVRAAQLLGQIGPPAKAAVPALREAAESPVPPVRTAALEALTKIES